MAPLLRRRGASVLATLLATLLIATSLAATPASAEDRGVGAPPSRRGETEPATRGPVVLLRSATGVRPGSTTVLTGAVLNPQTRAVGADLRIDGLPEGVSIRSVRPDAGGGAAPGWQCDPGRCVLVGPDGAPAELDPRGDVGVALVLSGDGLRPGTSVLVRAGGGPQVEVPLDRPDGEPALEDQAISVTASGTSTVEPGATATTQVTLGNLAEGEADLVSVSFSGGPPGADVTAAGDGWTCDVASRCTYGRPLPPLATSSPLVLRTAVPTGTPDGPGTLALQAAAQVGGTNLDAATTHQLDVRAPVASGLSARVTLSSTSVAAPATTTAVLVATPTGAGELRRTARLTLEVPDGLRAQWDDAVVDGPWSCSDEDDGCVSTGPLPPGSGTTVAVPVEIPVGAEPGLVRLTAVATVDRGASAAGDDTEGGSTDRGSTDRRDADRPDVDRAAVGLVINPPPVAELRAELHELDDDGSAIVALPTGQALQFPAHAPRPMVAVVTNVGSRAARAGSTVDVELRPDVAQAVESVGGDGWRCEHRRRVDARTPVRCSLELRTELASQQAVELPITLSPSGPGSSVWAVTSGNDDRLPAAAARRYRVDVGVVAPRLVPRIQVVDELVRDATGRLRVRLDNVGDAVALGGVMIVDLPAGVRPTEISGSGWACADLALRSAKGSLSCTVIGEVDAGASTEPLELELTAATRADRVRAWFWASSPGQPHEPDPTGGVSVALDVAPAPRFGAGPDLTVVTPVRGPDGVERPAVVVLDGTVPSRLRSHARWEQLCTRAGEKGCDATTPEVTWLDVTPGSDPTTPVARFEAPRSTDGPVTLHFRLTAGEGHEERRDEVKVRLVPASFRQVSASDAATRPVDDAVTTGAGGTAGGGPGGGGAAPSPGPDQVEVQIGDGSTLQVATRTSAVLRASATGTAPFSYRWVQTGGPTATVLGSSTSAELAFTTPDLEPDQISEDLIFEVVATDSSGGTASASAEVQVVWGDDGLQVQLAGGAPSVVATVDSPVVVTSQVSSAGAPYSYAWSVDGQIDLPSGTSTDGPTLGFTAPSSPGTGTASLTVTDSFGRVTEVDVDLSITRLPSGVVPAAMCTALGDLLDGTDATLSGVSGAVAIMIPAGSATVDGDQPAPTTTTVPTTAVPTTAAPTTGQPGSTSTSAPPTTLPAGSTSTTTSTTVPPPTCPADAVATFSDATVTLPGGLGLTDASGELSIAGVTLDAGTVTIPGNWGVVELAVPAEGLLLPFVSTSSVGVPTGVLSGDGAPFLQLGGWSATTQVTFRGGASPQAVLSASGEPARGAGSLMATGASSGTGGTSLDVAIKGLVGFGPVDVPLSGQVTAPDATTAPTFDVEGSVTDVPLGSDLTVEALAVSWTPSSAAGPVRLALGDAASPLVVTGDATLDGKDAQLSFGSPSTWSPAGDGGPSWQLVGTGSVTDDQLRLTLGSSPSAPWSAGRSAQVADVVAEVDADCVVSAASTCGPSVTLSGRADLSPLGPDDVAVSGSFDLTDGTTTLVGDAGRLTVAPLVVDGARLEIALDPTSGISTSAEGISSVLGAGRATSVDFGTDAVVAVAEVGDRQLVPGWTLEDTVALASDVATAYPLPDGTTDVPVTLTPGSLTGAATTTLPADLSDGVLPADLDAGVVTFPIDGPTPTSYLLTVPAAGGWDVIGGPGDPAQVTIDEIGFQITADGTTATVQVQGSGSVRLDPVGGGAGAPMPTALSGSLSTDDGSGLLDAAFTPTSPMVDALGVPGLTFDGPAVSVIVSDGGATATLAATTQLPPALAAALGGTPPPSVPVSGAIDAGHPCVALDLDVSAGDAVNPGGSGLLSASKASIALAPAGCEDRGPAAGMSVQMDGAVGEQLLEIDPSTFALTGSVPLGSVQVGGVQLDGATVAVDTTAAVPYTMSGQMVLDDVGGDDSNDLIVAVSGPVLAALSEGGQGTVQLSGAGNATTLTVGSTQLSLTSFAVAPRAILGSGTAALTVEATVPLLGGRTPVSLAGTVLDGTVQPLSGTVPAASYPLVGSDSLQATFEVNLGPTSADSSWTTSIASSPKAVLQVEGFTLSAGTATITDTGMDFDGAMSVPGVAAGSTAAISGPYTLGAADPSSNGDLQLTTASSAAFTLAGFSAAGTATLSRSAGTFSATQTATVSPGLFDSDTSITVTGDLVAPSTPGGVPTATLSNAEPVEVALRGLDGTATLTFTPGTGEAGAKGWYDAQLELVSAPDACDMWGAPPTLTGQIYRSGTTTYYTLTTWVQPSLVAGLVISPVSSAPPQPVMLSNEVAEGEQPAPGVTVQLGVQTETFTAQGILSLSVGSCSYTIGATAMLTFGGGSQSAALGQNFGGAAPAVAIDSQLFGPDQSLPEAIARVRRAYQLQSLAEQIAIQKASLEQAFEQANQQAEAATKVNEGLQAQADARMGELEAANQRLAAAQEELANARTAMQTAAAQQDVDGAEADVQAAAQRVSTAQSQVSASASQLWDLNEVASDAGALAEQATFDQMVAEGEATTAGSALSNYEKAVAQQEAQQKSVKTLQITVEYTHCTTCDVEDTATLDGELYFAETYIAGIDLTVEWGEGQLDEVMGTFSVGWMKQYTVGWSHLYLYGMVEVEVELTVGWNEANGWDNLDIELDATADITAYLDLWFATYSATLAEVELDGTLALLPSPASISGSATIDVFGYSDEFSFGPTKL